MRFRLKLRIFLINFLIDKNYPKTKYYSQHK